MKTREEWGISDVVDGRATDRALAWEAVRVALARVLRRGMPLELRAETSLVDDLCVDSLRFVDLAVALENELGIVEFPLQEWHDVEAASEAKPRFTVGSLVDTCVRCMTQPEAEAAYP